MSYSQADLVQAVLEELGALEGGGTPSTEDSASVTTRIASTVDDLANRNVIYIPDTSAIEPKVFNHLVSVLAEVCAPKFGRAANPQMIELAERKLRTLARIGRGTGALLTVDSALQPRRFGAFNWTRGY